MRLGPILAGADPGTFVQDGLGQSVLMVAFLCAQAMSARLETFT